MKGSGAARFEEGGHEKRRLQSHLKQATGSPPCPPTQAPTSRHPIYISAQMSICPDIRNKFHGITKCSVLFCYFLFETVCFQYSKLAARTYSTNKRRQHVILATDPDG